MGTCQVSVEITTYVCVVNWGKILGGVFTIDAGEVFVDRVSIVAKVSSPSSSTEELNFDPEIRCSRHGKVIGRSELKPEMRFFVDFLGEGVVGDWQVDGVGDVLGEVDFSGHRGGIMHVGLQLESVPGDNIGNGDAYP